QTHRGRRGITHTPRPRTGPGGVEGAGDGVFVECCGDLGGVLAGGFFDTGAWGGVGAALELVPGDEAAHVGGGGGSVVEAHRVAGQVIGGDRDELDGADGDVVEHGVEEAFLAAGAQPASSRSAIPCHGDAEPPARLRLDVKGRTVGPGDGVDDGQSESVPVPVRVRGANAVETPERFAPGVDGLLGDGVFCAGDLEFVHPVAGTGADVASQPYLT